MDLGYASSTSGERTAVGLLEVSAATLGYKRSLLPINTSLLPNTDVRRLLKKLSFTGKLQFAVRPGTARLVVRSAQEIRYIEWARRVCHT
jgi:hypothetical protein